MGIVEAVILGVVQGLTEFLPVSSSGHLVLFGYWLHVSPGDLSFEVAVHIGTLAAVVIYLRAPLLLMIRALLGREPDADARRCGLWLIGFLFLGTLPAVAVGLGLKSRIESLFATPLAAALFLVVTGSWLLLMTVVRIRSGPMTVPRALWIGLAQAVAILPGISRSGSTIATGVLLGVSPAKAAEFSFLLSIPAILGASLLAIPDAAAGGTLGLPHVVGALVAGLVGYLALRWVFATLRRGHFGWFGLYCVLLGGTAAVMLW